MTKVIVIDPAKQEIREEYVETVKGDTLRNIVGGWIDHAFSYDNGDALFVDDEGLLKPVPGFFIWRDRPDHQPLAGIGVIVGRELEDENHDWIGNADPVLTIEQVRQKVAFMSHAQVRAWMRRDPTRPMSTVTSIGRDGTRTTEVLATAADLYGPATETEE